MTTTALHALPAATPALPGGATLSESAMHEAGDGFAAALDEAKTALEALDAAATESNAAMPTALAAATGALPSTVAVPPITPTLAEPLAGGESETAIAALPEALAGAGASGGSPGWPPPGLSSLFPENPLFASALPPSAAMSPNALTPMRAQGGSIAAPPPFAATVLAMASNGKGAALAAGLNPGAEALPPDALGPRAPEAPLAGASSSAASSGALPLPNLAAPVVAMDPLAAALARAPAALRVPMADEGELGAITGLAEALAPERLPDGAAPLSTTTSPAAPKLDLAQAFPAPVPLPSKQFAEDLGARLQWMADQQGGDATLRISPEGLGPVEIRLKLDGERVELGFTAAQQETRQALQDALPKLREMLAQQGLQLGQADVGQKHAQSANDEAAGAANGFAGEDEGDGIVLATSTREVNVIVAQRGRGVLDLYA